MKNKFISLFVTIIYFLLPLFAHCQKVESRNNVQIYWLTDTTSKISLFRIASGYSPPKMKFINSVLEQYQREVLEQYYSCVTNDGGECNHVVSIELINDEIISFSQSTTWFCQGMMHYVSSSKGVIIDINNEKELSLNDILFFNDATSEYTYREKLITVLTEMYPERWKVEDECHKNWLWDNPITYFTEEGLYVGISIFSGSIICDEGYIIPYYVLKKHMHQACNLNFVIFSDDK